MDLVQQKCLVGWHHRRIWSHGRHPLVLDPAGQCGVVWCATHSSSWLMVPSLCCDHHALYHCDLIWWRIKGLWEFGFRGWRLLTDTMSPTLNSMTVAHLHWSAAVSLQALRFPPIATGVNLCMGNPFKVSVSFIYQQSMIVALCLGSRTVESDLVLQGNLINVCFKSTPSAVTTCTTFLRVLINFSRSPLACRQHDVISQGFHPRQAEIWSNGRLWKDGPMSLSTKLPLTSNPWWCEGRHAKVQIGSVGVTVEWWR